MFGYPALRARHSPLRELVNRFQAIEGKFRRDLGNAPEKSVEYADVVSSALEDIAERFRRSAAGTSKQVSRLGAHANVVGRDSYEYLRGEVSAHPFIVLGVAAGVGILIGTSIYRGARNASGPAERRERIKRRSK